MACASAPVLDGRLLSRFGVRQGIQSRQPTFHAGVDWRAPRGTEVYAPHDGIVELVGRDQDTASALWGYGNAVVLRHPDLRLWSLFAHMDRVAVLQGQRIGRGDKLGWSGNTTNGRFSPRQGASRATWSGRRVMIAHVHDEWRTPTPSGGSPFPGPYGHYNIDPLLVYSRLGLIRQGGRFVEVDRCDVSGLLADIRAGRGRREMAGFGQTAGPNDEYEPPLELGASSSSSFLGGLVGAALTVAGAVASAWAERR